VGCSVASKAYDQCLAGKRVLITGGTGSLGTALVRRLLSGRHGTVAGVTVFSRDEFKQFHLGAALRREYADCNSRLRFRLGDVRDFAAVQHVIRSVDVVFHAAALKQVPQCEFNPIEAVQTNVIGLANVVRASSACLQVEAVIAASSDKACHPVNVMGMTKALQERVLIAASLDAPNTRFMCARYGNVVGSRGSVVETFLAQIRNGGPVTLTRSDMTRFLLTLPDAVDALVAVYRFGRDGEIFVPQARATRIDSLAQCLVGDRPIELVETGLRPGEKIHEVLVSADEIERTTQRDGYYVIAPMLQKHAQGRALDGPFCSSEWLMERPALEMLLRGNPLPVPDPLGPTVPVTVRSGRWKSASEVGDSIVP
jgi:FlaA1/EpsC-like NDP-sugar epimerase